MATLKSEFIGDHPMMVGHYRILRLLGRVGWVASIWRSRRVLTGWLL